MQAFLSRRWLPVSVLLVAALACDGPPEEKVQSSHETSQDLSLQAFYQTYHGLADRPAEQEAYTRSLEGREVSWTGFVLDISEYSAEETTLVLMAVEFDPDDVAFIHFDNEWQQLLYSFRKHYEVRITGTVERFKSSPKLAGKRVELVRRGR